MTARGAALAFAAAVAVGACGKRALPPLPEAVVVVDTTLPVPRAAARLRVDFFDEGGRWFESRDVARPSPEDWPASFSVFRDDPSRAKTVWLRLRAYPEGRERDAVGTPRLLVDGEDRTPPSEPEPLVTVDRLIAVRLEPDTRGAVRVALEGSCVGTPVAFGAEPADDASVDVAGAASCLATERELVPVATVGVEGDAEPEPTRAGTWGGEEPCAPEDSTDTRVCVPSGVVLLGDRRLLVTPFIASTPERTFRVSRFWVDRHEVSVGRFRAALTRGFEPEELPTVRDLPLGGWATDTCTWSTAPMGREELPVTCLTWETARAFCRSEGGDLLTEAQWEYLATAAGRTYESMYPWGDDDPTCERAVFERLPGNYEACVQRGQAAGPQPVTSLEGDVNALGVMGLGGNVTEWVRDAFAEYGSSCWARAPVSDPECQLDGAIKRTLRGGAWLTPDLFVRSAMRQGHAASAQLAFEGIRCAYPGP